MDAAETRTVAVGGGDITGSGHCEPADINYFRIGDIHTDVGIYPFGFPSLGVDVEFGLFLLFEKIVDERFGFLYGNLVSDIFLLRNQSLMLGVMCFGEFECLGL